MSKATIAIGVGLVCLASTSALYLLTAAAQEPKRREKEPVDHPSSIVGTWINEVRHAVHWSLYQPVQGARVRDSFVYFKQDGDSLTVY
jgi:hypothetical protein